MSPSGSYISSASSSPDSLESDVPSYDLSSPETWGPAAHGWKLHIDVKLFPYFSETAPVVVDVEDDGRGNFVGIGLSWGKPDVYYYTQIHSWLKDYLARAKFIAHAGRTDLHKMKKWGINVRPEQLVFDTIQAAHTIDSTRRAYGLKDLAEEILGISYPDYKTLTGTGRNKTTLAALPTNLVANYNGMDVLSTWGLKEHFSSAMEGCVEYFESLEMPLSHVLFRMEEKGIRVDIGRLERLRKLISTRRDSLKVRLARLLGDINLNSPKQLLAALQAKGINPVLKRKPSTDKRALEAFRGTPVVDMLLKYSQLETLLTSFINPYIERGNEYVYPEFLQARTRTGRLACKNPNLQQIPARSVEGGAIRSAFVPGSGGTFWDGDFGQIEPRIMAHLSQDPILCGMFASGINFHKFTAERLGMSKDRAKVLNLSVGYRATSKSVSAQLKCSEQEAQAEIGSWWKMFPRLREWENEIIAKCRADGYVTTLFGRKILIENINDGSPWRREAAERDAINNLVQGSAAEVMKKGLIALDKAGADIRVTVHDEALIEIPKDIAHQKAQEYKEILERCVGLSVPLVVEGRLGKSWQECK